jgi:hypothetical protein
MGKIRSFDTGATRDTADGKVDYTGILSPLFLVRFGEYMRKHRSQPDGTIRPFDNWKLGIPMAEFPKSGLRHFVDWLLELEGFQGREDIEEACCAIFFNIQGYMHEKLKKEGIVRSNQKLEELIKKSSQAKASRVCWAAKLKGDAKQFVGILQQKTQSSDPDERPVFARVAEILQSEFGLTPSRSGIITHLKGECQCQKQTDSKGQKSVKRSRTR